MNGNFRLQYILYYNNAENTWTIKDGKKGRNYGDGRMEVSFVRG